MDSQTQQHLNILKEMREDDFTRLIIKPLFESMGYERVDFNGGPLERGRDLIAQIKIPPKRELRVIYVQSKKIGNIQNTKIAAKLSTLVHQLRQCCTEKVTTIDGKTLSVDDIYLACPEQISQRLLDEISGQLFTNGHAKEIIPYDGPRILADIKEYMPELLQVLVKVDHNLLEIENSELINKELLSALKHKKELSIENFYSDLNFFVGSVDSNSLLHIKEEISQKIVEYHVEEWIEIKKQAGNILDKHKINIFEKDITEIEKNYIESLKAYESPENKEKINELKLLKENLNDNLTKAIDESKSLSTLLKKEVKEKTINPKGKRSALIEGVAQDEIQERIDLTDRLSSDLENKKYDLINIKNKIKKDEHFFPKIKYILELSSEVKELNDSIISIENNIIPQPFYKVKLNKKSISSAISLGVNKYINSVKDINNGACGPIALKRFLNETEKTLSLLSMLNNKSSPISNLIKINYKERLTDRVSISPHEIFSTGYDIAVYGGAGVGKTTTLQAYASLCSELEEKIITYVPLNRLIEKYRKTYTEENENNIRKSIIQKLILISKNQTPSNNNIEKLNKLLSRPISLILDGLDEVYSTMPFILDGISEFKIAHPSVQLIISSRDCVSYLDDIKFLGITLLPFTKDQLDNFIYNWIDEYEKAEKLVRTIEKKSLYENIKTPLLATITCSLVEKGIDAPSSEFEIYSERLKLLTGEYDSHKNVNRQEQKGDLLRLCARKIAFSMHRISIRSTSKEEIFDLLRSSMSSNYSNELLSKCIYELENPCNLLIKDSLTESYSFGHFRFQEHLASYELSSNRSIDIAELTIKDWWRGALSIYAQENDISHLFEEIYHKYGNIKRSEITLKEMIKNSPNNKKSGLKEMLAQFSNSDMLDECIIGLDEYDNPHYTNNY